MGIFVTKKIHRAVNAQLTSRQIIKDISYRNIISYISAVSEGRMDFLMLKSHDGFFQFYGLDDQFVAELRVDLPEGGFSTYSVIDKSKEKRTQRTQLTTPYGQFTPEEREVVSLKLIKRAVKGYYEHANTNDFLRHIPCIETTETAKECMGS